MTEQNHMKRAIFLELSLSFSFSLSLSLFHLLTLHVVDLDLAVLCGCEQLVEFPTSLLEHVLASLEVRVVLHAVLEIVEALDALGVGLLVLVVLDKVRLATLQ